MQALTRLKPHLTAITARLRAITRRQLDAVPPIVVFNMSFAKGRDSPALRPPSGPGRLTVPPRCVQLSHVVACSQARDHGIGGPGKFDGRDGPVNEDLWVDARVDRPRHASPQGRGLRAARPQRVGQDDDDPLVTRAPQAYVGHRDRRRARLVGPEPGRSRAGVLPARRAPADRLDDGSGSPQIPFLAQGGGGVSTGRSRSPRGS